MIVVRLKGGLGNQLFQYSAAYSLAKKLEQKLKLDVSFFPEQTLRGYKLGNLAISSKEIVEETTGINKIYSNRAINKIIRKLNIPVLPCGKDTTYLLETRSDLVPEYFTIEKNNIYIEGYFQCEQYFSQWREQLNKQFQPNYQPEQEYIDMLRMIKNTCSVAVHVRRGDFLKVQHSSNPNQYLLGKQYYYNAMQYINGKIGESSVPVYYWFSDDIDWVKQNLGDNANFRFVNLHTLHPDIDEMMLMKNCQHIIAANSTFSWWASWLNEYADAIHLCPAKRYGNLHMIPDRWVKIDVG